MCAITSRWLTAGAILFVLLPSGHRVLSQSAAADQASNRSVEELIDQLRHGDERTAEEAINSLAKLGADAVPALMRLGSEDDLRLRLRARQVFEKMGDRAIPPLLAYLDQPSVLQRLRVVSLLRLIGTRAAVPVLIRCCSDRDAFVRNAAIDDLSVIGDRSSIIVLLHKAIRDPDRAVRERSVAAMWSFRAKAAEAVPELVRLASRHDESDALPESSGSIPKLASLTLASIGEPAVAGVRKLLADNRMPSDLKQNIIRCVGEMASPLSFRNEKAARSLVPDLVPFLRDKDPDIRQATLYTLSGMGAGAKEALGELELMIRRAGMEERLTVMRTVLAIDRSNSVVVKEAVAQLTAKDAKARLEMLSLLRSMGPDAMSATPAIQALSESDPDPAVRKAAYWALVVIRKGN